MKWTWTAGNCQVRATLSSRSGGLSWAWMEETSAPWGHIKRPRCSLSLFPAVFRYDLKGYTDTSQYRLFLRHSGNTICTGASFSHLLHQIQTQQCDAVGPQSHHRWANLDRMRKNLLYPIAGWWFLIVLAKIWNNLSKTLPAAMWRDLHAEALACRVRTEIKESYQEASS